MKTWQAWLHLTTLIGISVLAYFVPVVVLVWLLVMTAFDRRFGRAGFWNGFLVFAVLTIGLDALLLAWASPGTGPAWSVGPITLGQEGAILGAMGGLRIVAITGVNLAWLQQTRVAAVIQALHLPRPATVFLAAVLIAMQDIGRDFQRMVDGRKMTGTWPRPRLARVRAVAGLVTPLLVASVARARVRRDALRLAGIPVSERFVPLVALTALALAGRLALVAVPNVSLVHVVVFVGGMVFGPVVAMGAAALAMGLSDVLLSGLVPTAFVNVPAMALVGLLGASLRGLDYHDGAGRTIAATMGVFATFLFSITADVGEWLLVPEFRGDLAFLQARLAAGLAFNVLPALVHGALFALVCGPVQTAFSTGHPEPAPHPPSPSTTTLDP